MIDSRLESYTALMDAIIAFEDAAAEYVRRRTENYVLRGVSRDAAAEVAVADVKEILEVLLTNY